MRFSVALIAAVAASAAVLPEKKHDADFPPERSASMDGQEIGPLGQGYKLYSKRVDDTKPKVPTSNAAGPLGQGYMLYSKRDKAHEPKAPIKNAAGPLGQGYMLYSKRGKAKEPEAPVKNAAGPLGQGYMLYSRDEVEQPGAQDHDYFLYT
ncbi:hypothetical protein HIM_00755 [Hirsutella minnesotensis 3608]|nr:hypothetical protein HIM_00755 [Hirsutella minnesotensis 3608]